jgi:PAS domain S-box-containing protein
MPTSVHNGFRESEEGYRLLFESNPHAMWIYDRDTLAFLAVNDAAIQRYGYARQEFLNMTLKEIRLPQDIPSLMEKVSLIKPGMNSASSRHIKKDGTLIDVEIVSHTLDFNGRRAELVLAMDVTQSEQSEQNGSHQSDNHSLSASAGFADEALTEAERRVARYVARGFSNKQIARLLGVSSRTIENHISHILLKKSFKNRVQIARHVFSSSSAAFDDCHDLKRRSFGQGD